MFDFQSWIRDDRGVGRFTVHPEYDSLPEVIKHTITAEQHAWMTEAQRNRLIEDECYPEPDFDD